MSWQGERSDESRRRPRAALTDPTNERRPTNRGLPPPLSLRDATIAAAHAARRAHLIVPDAARLVARRDPRALRDRTAGIARGHAGVGRRARGGAHEHRDLALRVVARVRAQPSSASSRHARPRSGGGRPVRSEWWCRTRRAQGDGTRVREDEIIADDQTPLIQYAHVDPRRHASWRS